MFVTMTEVLVISDSDDVDDFDDVDDSDDGDDGDADVDHVNHLTRQREQCSLFRTTQVSSPDDWQTEPSSFPSLCRL